MDFDFSTETITPDTTNLLTIGGTGGLELPIGTTAQRPVSGLSNGTMRYNTDLSIVETYSNSSWTSAVNPGTVVSVTGSGGTTGLTLTGGPITSTGTLTLGGILAPANGGTGTNTSTAANGQILIGNGTGLTLNTITAGTAISVTNGSGSITIANTGVTSNVAGTGISVSGATGAVTITNTGVTSIAGTTNQITASAATGAVTLSTPSTFIAPGSIRATTTMTVDGLTANSFLFSGTAGLLTTTAAPTNGQLLIGSTGAAPVAAALTAGSGVSITNAAGSITIAATGSGGTVTSVNVSGGTTGLTTSGGPITGSGTITLAGTLVTSNGGTGLATIGTANQILGVNTGATGLEYKTVTAGTAISITPAAGSITINNTGVTSAIGTAGNITVSSATGAVTFNLATAGTPVTDQFRRITTDTFGRVTATSAVTSGDITTALGYTPVNKAGDSMSGTLTMTGGSTQIVLPNSPVAGTDAANKNYVDAAIAGLSWKQAVRAATTVTGTLATAFANGQLIDGVTLATNDRILIKNQSTQTENGIYIVQASGAPVRSSDADTGAELVGASVYVDQGTVNADSGWVQVTNAPITIGVTNIVWSQFSGSGAYTAGTGLTLTGNTFSLTSPVLATLGGTGQTVYAVGDLLAANTTTTLTRVADVATGNALISGGVSTLPLWGKIGLTTHVSGVLPIANGGTNLSTTPANGQLLIGNGTGYTLAGITAGTAISVTNGAGTITVANTGVTSIAGTTNQITASAATGAVTLSTPATFVAPGSIASTSTITAGTTLTITGNTANTFIFSGTAGLVTTTAAPTNGQLLIGSTGSAPVAAALTAGSGVSVTNGAGSITIANTGVLSFSAGTTGLTPNTATTGAVTLAGTLAVANGGTGLTTTPANGQIDIGNGTGFTRTTITAGTGISVTNGAGTITIAATGGTGTVTSVGLALPSFITVSGSPVTTSGTLTGTLATQTANTVFAGPTTGGATAPTFRALVAADVLNTTAIQLYRETASSPTTPVASGNNSVAIGSGSSATGVSSFAVGAGTAANVDNVSVYANGNFATAGDAQNIVVMLRNSTTDATATDLFINGSSQRLVLPNNSAWTFNIRVVGRRTDTTGDWAMYTFIGGITRDASAATTNLRGSSRTTIDESAGALNCAISADTTNGALTITVTGQASKTIRWVATAEITQVTN